MILDDLCIFVFKFCNLNGLLNHTKSSKLVDSGQAPGGELGHTDGEGRFIFT